MDHASSPQNTDIDVRNSIHPQGTCEGYSFIVKAKYVNHDNASYDACVEGQCLARVSNSGTTTVAQSDYAPDRFGNGSSAINITFGTDGGFTLLRIGVLINNTGALKGHLYVEIAGGPDPTP